MAFTDDIAAIVADQTRMQVAAFTHGASSSCALASIPSQSGDATPVSSFSKCSPAAFPRAGWRGGFFNDIKLSGASNAR